MFVFAVYLSLKYFGGFIGANAFAPAFLVLWILATGSSVGIALWTLFGMSDQRYLAIEQQNLISWRPALDREIDTSISVFITHFRERVDRLEAYELDAQDYILKKNVIVSLLDAISRSVSDHGDSNRQRFTALVSHFGDWPNHKRVSAPHTNYFLKQLRSPTFEPAREFVEQIIQRNSDGRLVSLDDDPELEEIRKYWPVPVEQKLVNQLSLSSFTHINLLYSYRNSLVHEFREPGYGMEFNDDGREPYYHGMTTLNDDNSPGQKTLELVYPLKFYFKLVRSVLGNVESYLRKHQMDPYLSYQFGSSWVSELND